VGNAIKYHQPVQDKSMMMKNKTKNSPTVTSLINDQYQE